MAESEELITKNRCSNEEILYRRYYQPERKYTNPDGSAHSRVFKPRHKDNGQLSVNLKSLTTVEESVIDPAVYLLFEIDVISVRATGLDAIHDPVDGNYAHGLILTIEEDDDIKPALLARAARKVFI